MPCRSPDAEDEKSVPVQLLLWSRSYITRSERGVLEDAKH